MPDRSTSEHPIDERTIEPFVEADLDLPDRRDGKVRVSWSTGPEQRLFVTTDRLSAFDRILAGVVYKGQVLNELSAWWFDQTADIVANHKIAVPDPNALLARAAVPLPVEVVVRGHITGVTDTSIWGMYASGQREMYGHRLPDGLAKNAALPHPIITPTTKAEAGGHDRPVSVREVAELGLLEPELWDRVQSTALSLFERGRQLGANGGLILADTKYEFGVTTDGELLLIDEIHTPDSSRWWSSDAFDEAVAEGREPDSLDKEMVRRAYAERGYRGDGAVPELPAEVWSATSARYIEVYERLVGAAFVPGSYPIPTRLITNLTKAGVL